MRFANSTDPVLEPLPVQRHNLEHERDALDIETVVRGRGEDVRVREPGAAHAAGQGDDKEDTICTADNNCGKAST